MKSQSTPTLTPNEGFLDKLLSGRSSFLSYSLLALILVVILPLTLSEFRLNMCGKYLCYSFCCVGLVLCWGHAGILSLGQGLYFGLGGYSMAMFLKLEASDLESTKIQTTPGIPDFMDWNQLTELPWFWQPYHSFTLTLLLIIILPILLATLLSFFYFKGRVTGVVFAILTQSMVACAWYFIVGNQGFFGGINGMTDLKTLNGWDIREPSSQKILYFITVACLFGCLFFSKWILNSRLGRVLSAQRDKEERVRFSGYDLTAFRVFIFAVAGVLASIGGALFTLQVGFMSPNLIGVVPSIDLIIYTAVGGRLCIVGAVYGSLLVNTARTLFSEAYPTLWVFIYGALFIIIVLALPKGIAGIWSDHLRVRVRSLLKLDKKDKPEKLTT